MRKLIGAIAIFFVGVFTVQAQVSRELGDFSALEVTDKINVTLILSDKNRIVVDGELGNKLEIIQKDNSVRLKMAVGYNLQGKQAEVTLYASNLSNITLRKGAILSSEQVLKGDSVYLSANEGARLMLNLDVNSIKALSTSGAVMELDGNVKNQNITIAAGGQYFSKGLKSEYVTASVNAGGKCHVYASEGVDVQTRAGGVIDIYGNPADRKEQKLLGGKVSFL